MEWGPGNKEFLAIDSIVGQAFRQHVRASLRTAVAEAPGAAEQATIRHKQ